MNELQDDLLDIINEPISKNVCCLISWIGDFDYKNSKATMIENAGFTYIVDQLTTFAKKQWLQDDHWRLSRLYAYRDSTIDMAKQLKTIRLKFAR